MCRHLAYLGPAAPLSDLLIDAPHGLVAQARAPRWQVSGKDNPDGYGVAWWTDDADTPRRHRSTTCIWEDPLLPRVGDHHTGAVVAAARLASPGSPVDVTGNAPFVSGRYAWSLNGVVNGWHDGIGDELRARVTPERRVWIEGVTDGEALFALALDAVEQGASLEDAVAGVITTVESRTTGRLNIVLGDGHRVVASARGNSLFARGADGSCLLASEPLDADGPWEQVADGTVVIGDVTGLIGTQAL
ncbi:MAG TPA: class II glutamine amidotransferase [Acidimicrobiia bacterium]